MKTLIAIVLTGLAAASAAAQDRVAIEYTDIATSSDADALYHRIRNAAEAVCPQDPVLGLHGHSVSRKCQRNAVAKAVEAVDSPLLTARHHGEMGNKLYSSSATRK
jgi:UrcA family protein